MIPTCVAGIHEFWRISEATVEPRSKQARRPQTPVNERPVSIGHCRGQSAAYHAGLANIHVGISVGSENSVPEEVDHREIAVRVQMVDKVKLLLAPEPSEACEPRSFGMVLLVKIYVRAERHRAGGESLRQTD